MGLLSSLLPVLGGIAGSFVGMPTLGAGLGTLAAGALGGGSKGSGGVPSGAIQNAFGTPNNTYNRNPDWVNTASQNIFTNASKAADTPYTPYTGQQVAPLSSNQQLAATNAANAVGRYAPTYGAITDYYNKSAQPNTATYTPTAVGYDSVGTSANPQSITTKDWTQADQSAYMNPYLAASLTPQLAGINQDYATRQNAQNSAAAGGGNFGGSRAAVNAALITKQQQDELNGVRAQGYNTAYNTGLQAFQSDQGRNLQGQQSQADIFAQDRARQLQADLANQSAGINTGEYNQGAQAAAFNENQNIAQQNRLAQQAAAAGLTALTGQQQSNANAISNNLMTTGAAQQQTQQAQDAAKYQDYLNQMYYPEQQATFLNGILKGNPAAGSIGTGYNPGTSGTNQAIGTGISAISGLSSLLKGTIPGMNEAPSNAAWQNPGSVGSNFMGPAQPTF